MTETTTVEMEAMNLQSSVVSAFLPLNVDLNLAQVSQSFGDEPIGFHET